MLTTSALRRCGALAGAALLLTACGDTAGTQVRTGPQAVHPSPSALAQGTAVTSKAKATAPATTRGDLADQLFKQYCVGKTAAQSKAALAASGKFGPPTEVKTSFSRYLTYPLLARDRAGVTVVTGSLGGIQCSVGIENKGPSLYEDGRISYSG